MDFKLITDVENKLFDRREIQGEIHAEISPKREEVLDLISKKLKVSQEKIKIKTIQPNFGSKVFLIVANIYGSEKIKDQIELKTKKEKALDEKIKKAKEEAGKIENIPEQQNPDEVIKENGVKN